MTGVEPVIKVLQTSALPLGYTAILKEQIPIGIAGFEPAHVGVKVPCLTAWLYPNIKGGRWGSNPRVPEPQSGVLTTSPIPPWQG